MKAFARSLVFAILFSGGMARAATVNNVQFCKGGATPLYLDYSTPSAPGLRPAVIVVHGGAWSLGDRASMQPLVDAFASAGYVALTIDYRLTLPWKSSGFTTVNPAARFPANVEDVKCSIRWTRANAAALGIDPSRISLLGASAGGHLVTMAALSGSKFEGTGGFPFTSSAVAAVIDWFGPQDLVTAWYQALKLTPEMFATVRAAVVLLLGVALDGNVATYRNASPQQYARRQEPPMLVIHGDADELVPYQQSVDFVAHLTELGAPVDFLTILGGTHGLPDAEDRAIALQASIDFLDELFQ